MPAERFQDGLALHADGAGRSLAGGGPDVLEPAKDVVQVEESVSTGQAAEPSSTIWLFRRQEEPRQIEPHELPGLIGDDDNFAWVDLSDYREEDMQAMGKLLDLHPVSVRAALSRWQRPRLDVFNDQFFVTATIARLDQGSYRVRAGEIDLFVGRNFLVSAHKLPLPLPARLMDRAHQSPTLMQRDSAYLLYIILDELLAHYESLEEHLQGEIETMEERALADTSDDYLEDLLHFKRYAFALTQLADQHREVFGAFLRPDFPFVAGEEMPIYFRDLEVRLSRLLGDLASAKDAINGAFDIYVSHVSHRTNQVIKVLTMVSAVLLPITVILGFFGTQFRGVPLYGQSAFLAMICAILGLTAFTLYMFRRSGWI